MILAIDLGTTYFKFTLFDGAGFLVRSASISPDTESVALGRLELPVDRFLSAIDSGISQVLGSDSHDRQKIKAITFSTQANSFLLLDALDRPLTPIILWPDSRAKGLEGELSRHSFLPKFTATTGVPSLNCEFMIAKLSWISKHNADIWAKTARLCLISDYLTLIMTGCHVSEAGVAALSGLVDICSRNWWEQALDRFSIPTIWLPEIVEAGTDVGPLLPDVSDRLRVPHTCRFVVGCLDQYAGAIGVGNVVPGLVSETTGTVLAAVSCSHRRNSQAASGIFEGPAFYEGLYWSMAFGNVSANYLHWYRDQLPDHPDFTDLTSLAARVAPGAEGLLIDHTIATPAEALAGLVQNYPRAQVVRCILEAVAFALRDHVANLRRLSEQPTEEVRSAGGGARCRIWLQIKADVLGIPIRATSCPEPTSLGAAILTEATLTKSQVSETAGSWVRLEPPCVPEERNVACYAALLESR